MSAFAGLNGGDYPGDTVMSWLKTNTNLVWCGYYQAPSNWCDTVGGNGYQPGVYCSHLLTLTVHTLRTGCRIWTFNVRTTQAHPVPKPFPEPSPSGCGYIGATIGQLGQNCMIGVLSTLNVDLDSAITPDPGAP